MIQLTIPKELKVKVWQYLQENNIGQRGNADGNQEQQYVGLLGEYAVKKELGLPVEFAEGFDGGFDIVDAQGLRWGRQDNGQNGRPETPLCKQSYSFAAEL